MSDVAITLQQLLGLFDNNWRCRLCGRMSNTAQARASPAIITDRPSAMHQGGLPGATCTAIREQTPRSQEQIAKVNNILGIAEKTGELGLRCIVPLREAASVLQPSISIAEAIRLLTADRPKDSEPSAALAATSNNVADNSSHVQSTESSIADCHKLSSQSAVVVVAATAQALEKAPTASFQPYRPQPNPYVDIVAIACGFGYSPKPSTPADYLVASWALFPTYTWNLPNDAPDGVAPQALAAPRRAPFPTGRSALTSSLRSATAEPVEHTPAAAAADVVAQLELSMPTNMASNNQRKNASKLWSAAISPSSAGGYIEPVAA